MLCGCIPYIMKANALEVLVISTQRKGKGMLFPKVGKMKRFKTRLYEKQSKKPECWDVQAKLGKWCFKSKGNDAYYEGHMFPLLVNEELDDWPEKDIRQRH
ncbi:putative hydrolase [Helianthus debilis subsp. tardiflorus]